MSNHADYSPSGFKRKALCPASHGVEKSYPNTTNPAAIDGTHSHTLLEYCLNHGHKDAKIYLGQKLIDDEGEFLIEQDRVDRVNMALQYVDNQVVASAHEVQVSAESELNPGSLIFREDWYGTGDITMVAVRDSGKIVWINVTDYKDGAQPVYPQDNYQGVSYMLGVIAKINPPFSTPIRFTIIQPKAGGIKEWDTTVGELMNVWLPKCSSIIEICESPAAPFIASQEACQYCAHRKKCEARQSVALGGINEAMGSIDPILNTIDTPANVIATPAMLPDIVSMNEHTISSIMLVAPIVKGWLKDIESEALERVKSGATIPNFKLVQKSGRRSWIDDEDLVAKAIVSMTKDRKRIFKKEELVTNKLVSFATVLANPNLSDSQKSRIKNDFIKSPNGQKALVLETEKGEDISPAAKLKNMPLVTMQNSTT